MSTPCHLSSCIGVDLAATFLSGILAGGLSVIHYAIRPVLTSLDERAQLQLRQMFIYRLRVLVPAVFFPTMLVALLSTGLGWRQPGSAVRLAAAAAVVLGFLVALLGTAPINRAVLSWQPGTLPASWRLQIARWERLDAPRTWLCILSFVLAIAALASRFHDC